ncbi:DUF72 domain-containing protein [Solimonas terrae]|uniref:DUF72 domain-containing protein n=1 Tax=Solimonas terrae TaxID=1396819 RepID=A0A6M2BUK5_9GAMM|nr:DUF72 domain-containing protein [Solimonas terrae]NGY06362.1 DUF72 domain-containing protein [Solimonas terrae]
MQDSLFGDDGGDAARDAARRKPARRRGVDAAAHAPALQALRDALPASLRLGTSSWNYPGWIGSVWAGEYSPQKLSKQGLRAYAQHPLLRSVSLDRAFYRPLDAAQYAAYAAQVPDDFRFVVKAPGLIADALRRDEQGRGIALNPDFLDPLLASRIFAEPARDGLRDRLGALVFQISPVPDVLLRDRNALLCRLGTMLRALPALRDLAPDAIVAVEVRDPAWLGPDFAATLRAGGATYCLGLHAKMPTIEDQLPILRALWPGPLVCRWNLHRRHGAYGYEAAKQLYGDFNTLVDPDPETRTTLARVIAGTVAAGHAAYVTLGNKAEGSAPRSVVALAEMLVAR